MKKKIITGLLAIAAFGMLFVGCDLFESQQAAGAPAVYEPLKITGTTINGDEVEIEISTKRTVPRVVLTPKNGDSYVLWLNKVERSQGTIVVNETRDLMYFYPSQGEPFVASYTIGDEHILLYEVPTADGGVITDITPPTTPLPAEVFYYVNDEKQLNDIIGIVKTSANLQAGQKAVICLTEAFYVDANKEGTYIKVDAGTTANTVPYTIRGLGKNATGANTTLKVGIWLANDNVTLEEVKIDITSASETNTPQQAFDSGFYLTAVMIGRDNGQNRDTYTDPVSNNVTVRNCDISIKGGGQIAGITLGGYKGATRAKSIDVTHSKGATNIRIEGNTVVAALTGFSACAGVMVFVWEPSINIINNILTAKWGVSYSSTIGDSPANRPASAIFFNRVNENRPWGGSIRGNTLSGKESNELFSFFINAMMPSKAESVLTGYGEDKKTPGIAAFTGKKFGTSQSTWATTIPANTTDLYERLFLELKSNITDGFGSFYMVVYVNDSGTPKDWSTEYYNFNGGVLDHVSYWGFPIEGTPPQYYLKSGSYDIRGGFHVPKPASTSDDTRGTGYSAVANGGNFIDHWKKNPPTGP